MNEKEETGQVNLGPHFTRQPPPRKIGVLRSLILVFMAGIGAVDVFLMGGVFLSLSLPSAIPVAAPAVQASAPVSGYYALRGGSAASSDAVPPTSAPVSSKPEQPGSTETSSPSQPAGDPEQPPAQEDAPDGGSPEGSSPFGGLPATDAGQEDPTSTPPPIAAGEQMPEQPGNDTVFPTTNTVDSPTISGTVYWVPNGEKYHSTSDCRTLRRSKTILNGTVDEAIQSGHLGACKVCC